MRRFVRSFTRPVPSIALHLVTTGGGAVTADSN
jgi:hypothetical protein